MEIVIAIIAGIVVLLLIVYSCRPGGSDLITSSPSGPAIPGNEDGPAGQALLRFDQAVKTGEIYRSRNGSSSYLRDYLLQEIAAGRLPWLPSTEFIAEMDDSSSHYESEVSVIRGFIWRAAAAE